MTPAHIFFIPSIFFLGFVVGGLIAQRFMRSSGHAPTATPIQGHAAGRTAPDRSGRTLAAALMIFVSVFVATHMLPLFGGVKALHHAIGGQPIFDQHASFSGAEIYARQEAFGPLGRHLYQRFTYTADVVFPLSLLAFLLLLARYVTARAAMVAPLRRTLRVLPIAWFASDMLENSIVFLLLSQFPERNEPLANVLGYVTATKFGLLLFSLVLPALVSVVLSKNRTARDSA